MYVYIRIAWSASSRASLDQAVNLACPLVIREDIEVISLSDDQAVSYKLDKKTGGNGITAVCVRLLENILLLCTVILSYWLSSVYSSTYVFTSYANLNSCFLSLGILQISKKQEECYSVCTDHQG